MAETNDLILPDLYKNGSTSVPAGSQITVTKRTETLQIK
jgi:hypothetical protein